ncbi:hypothetical protein [Methanocaldococcus sp.]
MKIKVYRLGILEGFIIFLILLILAILMLPLFLVILGVFLIYILFKYKVKDFFKKILYKIKRKKIKIEDVSNNGYVKINFGKRIEIEDSSDKLKNISLNNLDKLDETTKTFIYYLKNVGAELKDDGIYFKGYKVYPIFKKTYPINEIIKLNYPENIDAVILGLKGESYEPKYLYLIPKEFLKERMHIDEIKKFEIKV